jgi:catechol 2,3-dioxygenase-like lactoylglutathione lyase family enzyme
MTLSVVTLLVRDQDEALLFFTSTLGFIVREDVQADKQSPRWLVVAAAEQDTTGILLQLAERQNWHVVGKQAGEGVLMILETSNFDEKQQFMLDHGVYFEQVRTEVYGKVAVFRDLCGNRWDLIQRF